MNSTRRVTLEPTGRTGLQEVTERIDSLKLKEHVCLPGLTGDKDLQTLAGHVGLLKFWYTDNKGGNWSSTVENNAASV